MTFAFAWEFPAAVIGAVAVSIMTLALLAAIARTHHGPTRAEIAVLAALAATGAWAWGTRFALAQRFFPDTTSIVEERVVRGLLSHGDCAAFVAQTGLGSDDGSRCVIRVLSAHGRYVAADPPRKSFESPCDVTAQEEIRTWSFALGSLRDWCSR